MLFIKQIFSKIQDPSYFSYIQELRYRLVFIFITWIFFFIITYYFLDFFIPFLFYPISDLSLKIIHLKIYDKFLSMIKIATYLSFIFNFPILIYQAIQFIWSALYIYEKKTFLKIFIISNLLFFSGIYLNYKILAPYSFKFMLSFYQPKEKKNAKLENMLFKIEKNMLKLTKKDLISENKDYFHFFIENQKEILNLMKTYLLNDHKKPLNPMYIESYINFSNYVDFLIFMSIMIGLCFQIPVIISFLLHYGMLKIYQLEFARPYVILSILILSALITPPDILSLLIISIPSIILYELSILMFKFSLKKNLNF